MKSMNSANRRMNVLSTIILAGIVGIGLGLVGGHSLAQTNIPTEHKGLEVAGLGVITGDSMNQQIGLSGYKLQLREITILPGGQIAKHSHKNRPGLVKVISGTWIEGRPEGEKAYGVRDSEAILEDQGTVHWFWNRGEEPATAYVCDIVPNG